MSERHIFVIPSALREEREKELPMTEIIGGSAAYQYIGSVMIMAGSLWGLFSTARMIPLFTRSLTRHSRNIPGVKDVP
ncbi:hypothetical protein PJI16_15880 [Nitrospira sp. MA-1]|nr:hypothetical protein [Nitrospira sp. MA-1]